MIVVWRVTERCNLACGFCAYDRTLNRTRRDADVAEVRDFGAALSAYQQDSGDAVLVSWIGGEPLRWPALGELTRYFRDDLGLKISTTTNGTSLDSAATRRHLLQHYAELTVSIDALGERHDRLRGSRGLFARVRDGVMRLSSERVISGSILKLRANVVLMRHTIGDFNTLCAELATWGFDEITFNALGGRDRPEFFPENCLTSEQLDVFTERLPALREELAVLGVTLTGSVAYLGRMRASSMNHAMPVDDCGPGETFLFVDEQGCVAPCSFTNEDYGVPISELTSAVAIQRLPMTFARMRNEKRALPCDDCLSTHVFSKFAAAHG